VGDEAGVVGAEGAGGEVRDEGKGALGGAGEGRQEPGREESKHNDLELLG
jgi:hypothetical protein